MNTAAEAPVSAGVNHDWQLRSKFVTDTMMRCAACKALRVEYTNSKGGRFYNYRRKGHYNWHAEEPVCGPKPAAEPKPAAVKALNKNVSREAVAAVAVELRQRADEAHREAIEARDANDDNRGAVCGARFVAYATAAEAIERVLK